MRGARVQIGTDWQVLYNAPDLVDVVAADRARRAAAAGGEPEIEQLLTSLRGVRRA